MDLKQVQRSLKNCPFCGRRPWVSRRLEYLPLGEHGVYRIFCKCGVSTDWSSSLAEIMNVWNTRKGEEDELKNNDR